MYPFDDIGAMSPNRYKCCVSPNGDLRLAVRGKTPRGRREAVKP